MSRSTIALYTERTSRQASSQLVSKSWRKRFPRAWRSWCQTGRSVPSPSVKSTLQLSMLTVWSKSWKVLRIYLMCPGSQERRPSQQRLCTVLRKRSRSESHRLREHQQAKYQFYRQPSIPKSKYFLVFLITCLLRRNTRLELFLAQKAASTPRIRKLQNGFKADKRESSGSDNQTGAKVFKFWRQTRKVCSSRAVWLINQFPFFNED